MSSEVPQKRERLVDGVIVELQPLLADAAQGRTLGTEELSRSKVLLGELLILVAGDPVLAARAQALIGSRHIQDGLRRLGEQIDSDKPRGES